MGVICVDLGALTTARAREFLNLMEPVKLTVWKFMIERVTVVKFRINDGGGKLVTEAKHCIRQSVLQAGPNAILYSYIAVC